MIAPLPYHEIVSPPVERGTLILLHGGGWETVGSDQVRYMRPLADAFARYGWRVINTTYRPFGASLRDVIRVYDRERRRTNRRWPICAYGMSAGGHLALMLAVRRPALACAISAEGMLDLTRPGPTAESRQLSERGTHYFGNARRASPLTYARSIRPKVLLEYERTDPYAPIEWAREFARRSPRARLIALEPGPIPWVHKGVTPETHQQAADAERRLLSSIAFRVANSPDGRPRHIRP